MSRCATVRARRSRCVRRGHHAQCKRIDRSSWRRVPTRRTPRERTAALPHRRGPSRSSAAAGSFPGPFSEVIPRSSTRKMLSLSCCIVTGIVGLCPYCPVVRALGPEARAVTLRTKGIQPCTSKRSMEYARWRQSPRPTGEGRFRPCSRCDGDLRRLAGDPGTPVYRSSSGMADRSRGRGSTLRLASHDFNCAWRGSTIAPIFCSRPVKPSERMLVCRRDSLPS